MSTPFINNDSRNGDIRQEDLLDLVEELEKRRRKLLVAVTDNFVSWGRLLTRTRQLIEEMKRRKWEKR